MTEFEPLPPIGTMKVCAFCHFTVTLQRAESGWYYWVRQQDPVDGRRHCDGGTGPGTIESPSLRTLHVPDSIRDATGRKVIQAWAWRYTPEGEGRLQ